MRLPVVSVAMLLLSSMTASHADQHEQQQASEPVRMPVPEWTEPQSEDPAAADFQEVVTVAALMIDSDVFDDTWSAFIAKYYEPGMSLDGIIERVIDQAAEFRRQFRHRGRVMQSPLSRKQIQSKMNDLARAAIDSSSKL